MDTVFGQGDAHATFEGALDTATRALVDYVVPIFALDDRCRPEVVGSAVPLNVGGTGLLLTAGHVLGEPRHLYSSSDGDLYQLDLSEQCRVDSSKEGFGPADLGVVRLSATDWQRLLTGGKRALVPANLVLSEPLASGEAVAFVGFPSTRAKRRPDKGIIERNPFAWVGYSSKPEEYKKQGLLQDVHVLVPYGKGLPDLRGMSGGGAWRLRGQLKGGPSLLGVGIECRKKTRYLVAMRAGTIVSIIHERFPELSYALPSVSGLSISFDA